MPRSHGNHIVIAAAVSAAALAIGAATARAGSFVYTFDNGQVAGSAGAGTPLVPGTTAGTVGQDNWVLTSGASSVVRTDPITGFSGNYAMSPTVSGTATQDGILTRTNDANYGYSIGSTTQIVLTMDLLVGASGGGTTQSRRSEMALGVDLNEDGKIRPTAATSENSEISFFFGYEVALGWYVRPAAFGTAVTYLPATVPSGTWQAQLVVDLAANQGTVKDASSGDNVTGGNGAGSLYVRQLADGGGNPVTDSFHAVDQSLLNVNLGIMRMASVAGGAAWAADPSHWNGLMIRTAGNGGMDNLSVSTDPLTAAPVWALNGSGNWNAAGNWYPSVVPNAAGAVADFGGVLSAGHTIFSDTDVTVGTLHVNNANTYVFAGAGTLTMQVATGNAQIQVDAGTQKINLPLTIASDTTISVAPGATLKISDPVTVNGGKSLTQSGGGTVVYESHITLQAGATLGLSGPTSVEVLSLSGSTNSWSSTVDVGNGALVLQQGSLSDLLNQLKSGYNGGAWNGAGILSTTAMNDANHATGLAYADAGTLLGLAGSATGTFDGSVVRASSLVVKYAWFGDANLDGKVTGDDFALLDRGRANGLTGWVNGDFNYDGAVTVADYALIDRAYFFQSGTLSADFLANRQAEFGDAYVAGLMASVPEPSVAAISATMFVASAFGRRLRRR